MHCADGRARGTETAEILLAEQAVEGQLRGPGLVPGRNATHGPHPGKYLDAPQVDGDILTPQGGRQLVPARVPFLCWGSRRCGEVLFSLVLVRAVGRLDA